MELADILPIWGELTAAERQSLLAAARKRRAVAGTLLHSAGGSCLGLFAMVSGRLRAYIVSPEGREITLYRLGEKDICLMSASCMIRDVELDINIEAEKDSEFFIIPTDVYRRLSASSAAAANFTNRLMAARFADVIWLMEQIMWKSFDRRLAEFLLKESALEGGDMLNITHEKAAAHLGTAREVVTRMLRYFQNEGLVQLERGKIKITDRAALSDIAEKQT